ncbi:MAG: prohibitin family protein [Candidatus Omnitrophica bacterium]|nr:prohibitin family protein [Candidatus Omnitrophota bacterium]MCM8826339.1 prohibitin family protein [Candidatus Omnitrophota bacterium]
MAALIILVMGFVVGIIFTQLAKTGSLKPIVITTIVGLIIGVLFSSIRVVPAGYVGVVDFFGYVSPKPLNSGINFVNPLVKVVPLSIRTQEEKETMSVPSKEGLNVALDVSVLYRLNPIRAVDVYKTIGPVYKDVVLIPQFRASARGVTVGYEAKALYTSEREMLARAIYDSLKNLVEDRGIIIERVLLRAITLPTTVSSAIEQKLKAEQEAERMKFVLEKEKLEAERKRVEAEGIRDAQAIINQSLTSQYLHYLWINTLNQNPNVIYVATEANMPIFRVTHSEEEIFKKKEVVNQKQDK